MNCPDILVNNHRHQNSLWRNNCQGVFHDVMLTFDIDRTFVSETNQDTHGSSFGDIDNDGDQDIFSARSSGGGRGQLFINNNGFGDEQGSSWGFDSCTGGRLGSFLIMIMMVIWMCFAPVQVGPMSTDVIQGTVSQELNRW